MSTKSDLSMARAAIAVAINELYASHLQDVLRLFTVRELQHCDLMAQQVKDLNTEDVYRQAFDALFDKLPGRPRKSK